jgi:hypothetical protein
MKTGHIAAGLLALALIAPTGAAEPLIDQIDNGGFEDVADDGTPAEWRVVAGEVDTTGEAYEGDQAAQLKAVGDSTVTTLAQEVSLDNDDLPTVPTLEYEISFAADLNAGAQNDATTPPKAFGQIVWKNALGETSRVDRVTINDTDGFAAYTATFDAPEDATAADIQFHLVREDLTDRTDANLRVDAAAFGPADPAPA